MVLSALLMQVVQVSSMRRDRMSVVPWSSSRAMDIMKWTAPATTPVSPCAMQLAALHLQLAATAAERGALTHRGRDRADDI